MVTLDWDQYLFDSIINHEISISPDEDFHIDHFENAVRAAWPEYDEEPWNIKPNDSRHYLRCRLSEKARIGNIANPRYQHYSQPRPPDHRLLLNWEEVWDDLRSRVKESANNEGLILGYNGIEYSLSPLRMKGKLECTDISYEKGGEMKSQPLTEDHIKESITRLNTAAGRCEKPSRYIARNVVLVELIDRLKFDAEGFVAVIPNDPEDTDIQRESGSPPSGGSGRGESDWNARTKRSSWDSDYEPTETDQVKRKKIIEERTDRHEDLVDFVIGKVIPEESRWKEGEYDLMVSKPGINLQFWEMKTIQPGDSGDQKRQVLKALSQLKYYSYNNGTKGSFEIACFEKEISTMWQRFLGDLGVFCCWRDGEKMKFSELTPQDNSWGLRNTSD